jgi:hypothetical protein
MAPIGVVDEVLVGEHHVAAPTGADDHVKDRRDRWVLGPGDIGVPDVGLGAALTVEDHDLGVVLVELRDEGWISRSPNRR